MNRLCVVILLLFSGGASAHLFKQNDLTMDVQYAEISNGSDIIMHAVNGGDNQNFIYEDGSIKLAVNKQYCLDVNRSNNNIILWSCHGGYNQKFTISDGVIWPADRDNECLTVVAGNRLKSEKCTSSSQQKFNIPKICTYRDANFRGMTECTDSDLSQLRDNDTLSSISVVNASGVLYEHGNFTGKSLAFSRNIGFVGDLDGNFNDKVSSLKVSSSRFFLMTSDTQLVCTGNCNNITASQSKNNIETQYEMFNRYHKDVEGVFINGDLTEYGHLNEWNDFERLVATLKIPYYYGLGNHDIYNNYNDCYENNCGIRSITKLYHHVSGKENVFDFDVKYSYGYVFPEIRESIRGSLSYAMDFGEILAIQLNDFDESLNPLIINQYSSGGGGTGAMRYDIERNQDKEYVWLEQQLYAASQKKQIVIVNQHRDTGNAGNLIKLLDKYKVKLRFAGHLHYNLGERENGFFLSGSTAMGTYLKTEIDVKNRTAKIYSARDNAPTPELIKTISLDQVSEVMPPPAEATYLRVKSSGGYEAFVDMAYTTSDGKRHETKSAKLLAGNTWSFTTPPGATVEYLEARNNTGLVWEPQRKIFRLDKVNGDTCVDTWGTTLSSAWKQVSCR